MVERDDAERDVQAELLALIDQAQLPAGGWEPPPPGLWERIEAATAEDAATKRAAPLAPVAPPPEPRRPSGRLLLAAAAAILIVATLGAILWWRDDDGAVVASVDLETLGAGGTGSAQLVEHDGALQLRLETEDLDPGDGYLELWLIDPSVSRLVSLGPLREDGRYDLPAHVDPAVFPIVDVSIEPVDGDPTHSGDSVLRGELSF
jgi:Anti-sigma-K factor rskA